MRGGAEPKGSTNMSDWRRAHAHRERYRVRHNRVGLWYVYDCRKHEDVGAFRDNRWQAEEDASVLNAKVASQEANTDQHKG